MTEEKLIKVWEEGDMCGDCSHFHYGPGGPDPSECDMVNGEEGTELDDCPGLSEDK